MRQCHADGSERERTVEPSEGVFRGYTVVRHSAALDMQQRYWKHQPRRRKDEGALVARGAAEDQHSLFSMVRERRGH
jgi:hypothetical protein